MSISTQRLDEIVRDCLLTEGEVRGIGDREAISVEHLKSNGVIVSAGVVNTFGFSPERIVTYRDEVLAMLKQLPAEFFVSSGGGWTFLNACVTADGEQWGEQADVERLVCLGQALGFVRFLMPRDMWAALPGGMPYFAVDENGFNETGDGDGS